MGLSGIGDRVEGTHAVTAALRAGRIERLWVEVRPDLEELVAEARRAGAEVEFVEDVRPLATTEAPQGVVGEGRPIPTLSLEEVVGLTDPSAVMVLDHLEDPQNVGAVARSLLAAGLRAMVVSTRRAAPVGPTAFKAASGALEEVRVCAVSSIAEAVSRLQDLGLWAVGLTASARDSLFGLELLTEPVALVIGAEGPGLSRLVEERVDVRVRIPLMGPVESLNASVAAALAAYEVARVRGWIPSS